LWFPGSEFRGKLKMYGKADACSVGKKYSLALINNGVDKKYKSEEGAS
jgi:hypothetical protein